MKKDLKTLNKSVAIAIAAAMTATSAPTPLLASDFTDGGDFVSESPAAEADTTEEAAVEADGFGDEAAVAAVTEDGFGDSEAVADAEESGSTDEVAAFDAEAPGKIGHVAFDEEDKNVLTWYADQKADEYQIRVTDGEYTYRYYYNASEPETGYPSTVNLSYSLTNLTMQPFKVDAEGNLVYKPDGKNGYIAGLENGKTYKVSVRAVNRNSADGTVAYGEWSDAVDYTYAKKVAEPKSVTIYAAERKNQIQVSGENQNLEVSIKDEAGNEYYSYAYGAKEPSYVTTSGNWLNFYENYGYLLKKNDTTGLYEVASDADGKYIGAFQKGKKYTVKVRAYTGSGDEKKVGDWSNELVVEADDSGSLVPEKTGNFKYNDEYEYVSWNRIQNTYVSQYEVEVDGKVAFTTDSNYSYPNFYLGRTYGEFKFERGKTYTIRVRGINYRYENGANKKQEGEWSDAYTVTYKAVDTSLKKISGVTASSYVLSWNPDKNADSYEIKITDEAGREYFESLASDRKSGRYTRVSGTRYSFDESDYRTYTSVDGVLEPVIYPATGQPVYAFEDGKTYNLSVRAVKIGEDGKEVYGDWSNAFAYKVTASDAGTSEKPAAVSGVNVNTEASEPTLRWNALDNVNRYEILVKDSAGREYVSSASLKDDGTVDKTYYSVGRGNFPSVSLSELKDEDLYTYTTDPKVSFDRVRDENGDPIKAMAPGESYTFQVRAVRTYTVDIDGKKVTKTVEGDWSAPSAAFTVDALQPITDLQYVKADDNYYYFTYSAKVDLNSVWYQIATGTEFTTATMASDWSRVYYDGSAGSAKLKISKNNSNLEAGKTYYVRAVSSADRPEEEEVAKLKPAAVSFTTDAEKAPKNVTGLEMYKESENSFEFRFDAVLEDGDSYELQYTDKAQPSEEDWVTASSSGYYDEDEDEYYEDDDALTLRKSLLKEGATYVRVVAYVKDKSGNKKYGTPSNVVAVNVSKATSAISNLKLVEKTPDGYVFSYDGTVRKEEDVEFWYSESPEFVNDYKVTDCISGENNKATLYFESLTPGKTYYVRARVKNDKAATLAQKYSAYTNTASFNAGMPNISVTNVITAKTVTLKMSAESGSESWLTGYQIQRKNGKKYKTIAKTTDSVYKNTKLKADTTYTYRVRPYYYDSETGKTTYGAWAYNKVTTWGGALKLKATPKSTTSVKLSWTKIKGAKGYEIYRCEGSSIGDTVAAGMANNFAKYKLIKTTSAKASSYTDKKLQSGMDYYYLVRAYKTVGNSKYYIDEGVYANLSFEMTTVNRISYANGKMKLSWQPVYAGKGYLVEKRNEETGAWETYKTLKASTSSITFPAADTETTYRVRAYRGQEYSNEIRTSVIPVIATPGNVKAVANKADGSITVTWNPVAGADYYRVYRTTSSWNRYNKDSNSYSYNYGSSAVVPNYVADSTTVSGYKYVSELKETTITDREIKYTYNGATSTEYKGPKAGVKYYYYVVAYKNGKSYEYKDSADATYTSGASKSASAMVSAAKIAKPTSPKAKATKGKITVSWKKVTGATGYQVYRSTKKGSGYKLVGTITKGSKVKYVDKSSKKAGTKYYYKVRAVGNNEAGVPIYSSYSTPKYAKAK